MGPMFALLMLIAAPAEAPVEGVHVASKMETATALRIEPNGHYRWYYSQGALDLTSEGKWVREGDKLILTSDPVNAPRFEFVGATPSGKPGYTVEVRTSRGDPIPAVDVLLQNRSGKGDVDQTDSDGRLSVRPAAGETLDFVALALPMFEFRSQDFKIAAKPGDLLSFRFDPNDLGKQAFDHEPVTVTKTGLLLKFRGDQLDYERQEGELEEVP